MEQQDLNKRLILALALSFFVFVGYSYLFPPAAPQVVEQNTTATSSAAPAVTTQNTAAPVTSTKANSNAPVTTEKVSLLATVTSKTFKMNIDTFGRISQYELLEEKYKDAEGNNLHILGVQEVKPLEVRFSDVALNEEAFKTPYTYSGSADVDVKSAAQTLTLTQKLSSVTITKKITIEPTGAYTVDVTTSVPAAYFITPGHRPMADTSMYMLVRGALVKGADDVILTVEDKKAEGDETVKNAKIASAFDRYVATMFYNFDKGMNVSILKQADDNPLIFVEGTQNLHLGGYIGPKEYHTLKAINPELTDAIEFGSLHSFQDPSLKYFYGSMVLLVTGDGLLSCSHYL